MRKLIDKALLIIIVYLLFTNSAIAAVYQLNQSNGTVTFNSSNWDDTDLWNRVGGGTGYPMAGDEIQFGAPVGGSIAALSIGSDLTLDDITFTATEWGSELSISGNVTNSVINENGSQVILTVNTGASLETSNGVTFSAYGSTLNVSGNMVINGDLRFPTGTTQYLNSSGTLTIKGDLYMEGGVINISAGNVIVEEDWVIPSNSSNGINSLDISGTASLEIQGNLDLHNGNTTNTSDRAFLDFDQINVDGTFQGKCSDEGVDGDGSLCSHFTNVHEASLPVNLVYFDGEKINNSFLLSWETASEQNSERFDIEASNDKRSWEVIGVEPAAGNSEFKIIYTFLNDKKQYQYYRLAQYDLDGTVEYFGVVVSTRTKSERTMSVYPNVIEANREVNLFFGGVLKEDKIRIQILNLQGKIIIEEDATISSNFKKLQIPQSISRGVYILNITINNQLFKDKLLVK